MVSLRRRGHFLSSLGAVTVPGAGRFGWFYGTDRWPDSASFRYRITDLRLVINATR
jgi:hypothetical protein